MGEGPRWRQLHTDNDATTKGDNTGRLHPRLHDALVTAVVPEKALARIRTLSLLDWPHHVVAGFCPDWDGESEIGEPVTLKGIEHLPALRALQVGEGTDLAPALDVPTLESVEVWHAKGKALGARQKRTLDALEKRGVKITMRPT